MATQPITSTTVPGWAKSTAGRTGATYAKFLAAHPDFDPWGGSLSQYFGQGAENDPIFRQAYGWLNEWARGNGFGDGSRIPLAQRAQMYMAFVERAHQQWDDLEQQERSGDTNAINGMGGVHWAQSLAARVPPEGWVYKAGTGGRSVAQGGNIEANGAVAGGGTSGTPPVVTPPANPYQPNAPATTASSGGIGAGDTPGTTTAPDTSTPATTPPVVPPVAGGIGPSLIPGVPGGPTVASNPTKNLELINNPKVALDYVMQQMGINTDRPGLFTGDLQQEMGRLIPAYQQLAGLWEKGDSGFNYADNPSYYLNQFAQNFRGGHGYQGLAGMANQIGSDPRWNSDILGSLGAQDTINAMQNRMFLGNAGTNPLYNQARAARWASAFGDRTNLGAFGRQQLEQPNLQPADWLRGSPWKDLLNTNY